MNILVGLRLARLWIVQQFTGNGSIEILTVAFTDIWYKSMTMEFRVRFRLPFSADSISFRLMIVTVYWQLQVNSVLDFLWWYIMLKTLSFLKLKMFKITWNRSIMTKKHVNLFLKIFFLCFIFFRVTLKHFYTFCIDKIFECIYRDIKNNDKDLITCHVFVLFHIYAGRNWVKLHVSIKKVKTNENISADCSATYCIYKSQCSVQFTCLKNM